jgi:type IV pilus assembly protein PilA
MQRARLRDADGFTLIELLVVILIIAILAAIAVPAFLHHRSKAQDAAAQSDVRTLVTQMEACYTNHGHYDGCPDERSGVVIGSGPRQVAVTGSDDTYELVAHSVSGNTFTLSRVGGGAFERSCTDAGDADAGCHGGSW